MGQPFPGGRASVVDARGGLQVQKDRRGATKLVNGQDARTGGIGRRMAEHQIDVLGIEPLPRLSSGSLGIDQANVVDFAPGRKALLNMLAIADQALAQTGELCPIGL
jgi:hypothetical protein